MLGDVTNFEYLKRVLEWRHGDSTKEFTKNYIKSIQNKYG